MNGNGKNRLNGIIDVLADIRDRIDSPINNDAFYGRVECLLDELDSIMESYKKAEEQN